MKTSQIDRLPAAEAQAEPYQTPTLTEYGRVQELTNDPSMPGIPGSGGTSGGGSTVF